MVIDGQLVSESANDRIALQVLNNKKSTHVVIGRFDVSPWFGSYESRFQIKLNGINREMKEDEIVLYSPFYGPSTLNKSVGTDIVLLKCKHEKYNREVVNLCKDFEVIANANNTSIPKNGYVISLGPNGFNSRLHLLNELRGLREKNRKNMRIFIRYEDARDTSKKFNDNEDITAGVPQLIKDGKIDITWEQEKTTKAFVETRHPRTAVAKLKGGKFLMITVDGRSEASGGIGLQDLAEYLLSLGATDAMNLDGGGSTTMFVDGKVVNKPSDKDGERKVSDAIIVTLRKK